MIKKKIIFTKFMESAKQSLKTEAYICPSCGENDARATDKIFTNEFKCRSCGTVWIIKKRDIKKEFLRRSKIIEEENNK